MPVSVDSSSITLYNGNKMIIWNIKCIHKYKLKEVYNTNQLLKSSVCI